MYLIPYDNDGLDESTKPTISSEDHPAVDIVKLLIGPFSPEEPSIIRWSTRVRGKLSMENDKNETKRSHKNIVKKCEEFKMLGGYGM